MLLRASLLLLCLATYAAAARLPGASDVQRIVEAAFRAPPVFPDAYEVRDAFNRGFAVMHLWQPLRVAVTCCCCAAAVLQMEYKFSMPYFMLLQPGGLR
jgi:hypothetical protein